MSDATNRANQAYIVNLERELEHWKQAANLWMNRYQEDRGRDFHALMFIRAVLREDPSKRSTEWIMTEFTHELRKYLERTE